MLSRDTYRPTPRGGYIDGWRFDAAVDWQQPAKIKEDYFGDNKSEKKEKYTKDSAALDEVFKQEIKAAGDDAKEKLRIEEAYQKAKMALAKKYGQEYNDTSKNFLENMTEDITEWLNSDLGQADHCSGQRRGGT